MRKFILVVLCLAAPGLSATEFDTERFVGLIESGRSMWRVPGIAVTVIENGEPVLQRAFGSATINGKAVDEHTLFANASTTKAMVVAGLLILADEGRLKLDDPVIRHLPEVHFHNSLETERITIRDLLAHRTGLPRTDFWTFLQRMPLAQQVLKLREVAPAAGPRERLIYQNTMYELAGLIIERISGKPWYSFLQERLWRPIGMTETYGKRSQIPAAATHVMPHAVIANELRQIPFDFVADEDDAAGSAWSSIHDMTLWAQFLLNDGVTADGTRLLSEAVIAEMFEPQQLSNEDDFYPTVELTKPNWRTYGLGWFQQDFQGRKIDFHTGSLDGLVAIIGLDRANRRAVIVLQNLDASELRHALLWETMDQSPIDARRNWIRDVYDLYARRATERAQEWSEVEAARLQGTRPALPLQSYFGTYRNESLGDIVFAAGRAGPDASVAVPVRQDYAGPVLLTGRYEYEVSHWHLDTFLVNYPTWNNGTFAEFSISPEGRITTVTVFDNVFDRVD